MSKKVLIAGGAGYIGTKLSNTLIETGYDVTVVDLLWFGNHLSDGVDLWNKDIKNLTQEEIEGFDVVIFMAGLSNDPMANFDPVGNFIENGAVPAYLAYLSKKVGVPRFIYASSCSIYGFTDNEVMTEWSKSSPQYPYGMSKLQGESAILSMEDDSFRPISLRKGTVGGWSPRLRLDLVVNTMTKYALTEGKIVVHNPKLWRPLVDIRDVVQAYIKSIESELDVTGIFNIGNGNYTIGELAKEIKKELSANDIEVDVEIQNRQDVRNYLADETKAKKILDFNPQYSPRDSVAELLKNIPLADFNFSDPKYYNIQVFKDMVVR
tara:strand:- start:6490 stop:7455 length:966 start_codon:yes stop_codon:yes gene_type:complete